MVKQNIAIVEYKILPNILEEIKDNLSFSIINFEKNENFIDYLSLNKKDSDNLLILANFKNKNFFLKKNFNLKNIIFLSKNFKEKDEQLNFIKFPIDIYSLVEKINILLIKKKYNNQSKIKINKYYLDLNSKMISNSDNNLKLTEKEMNIILFLHENNEPQKINVLQNEVWGYSSDLETHTVETHVYRLRKKISNNFKDDNFILSTDNGYFIE